MSRFVPVHDPERARCEQDEESLRKHRQFDTPFAQLPGNLNKGRAPKEDMRPLGRASGMKKDEDGLWRDKKDEVDTKNEIFDKKKMWGRETFEYSNPEMSKAEAGKRKRRPGDVGWGTDGSFGGKGEDSGVLVVQRGEVDMGMVKNEKGLWVPKKKSSDSKDSAGSGVSEFHTDTAKDLLRKASKSEDPRMEAAKPKGRDCENASQKALRALQERRAKERSVADSMGLTRKPQGFEVAQSRSAAGGGRVQTLNEGAQQVRPQKRHNRLQKWQGVQHDDDDARKVVGKTEELATIGHSSERTTLPAEGDRQTAAASSRKRSPSPLRLSSPSGSEDEAPRGRGRRSRSRSRRRSRSPRGRGGGSKATEEEAPEVVVDFF